MGWASIEASSFITDMLSLYEYVSSFIHDVGSMSRPAFISNRVEL